MNLKKFNQSSDIYNKTPGKDEIVNELIKGGVPMENMVYKLIIDIYRDKSLPVEMNEVLIVPIYKKGNKRLWKKDP